MRFVQPAFYLFLALLFAYISYERYWRWRDCIAQSSSSCGTPDGANLTASGSLWILPAGLFLILAALSLWKKLRR
ncbi:hypothetical protein [Paramesorhizobium deserti]|uniref:hypothetical protein n=1 Tax=Paramesorhizobium deserti TaxID=1494590 RepID=UPI0009EAA144|nr:hypothetical protein [Paramesorhizobium deserti]